MSRESKTLDVSRSHNTEYYCSVFSVYAVYKSLIINCIIEIIYTITIQTICVI